MGKLSRKITIQYLVFVLCVVTALVVAVWLTLLRASSQEYAVHLGSKKTEAVRWFAGIRRELGAATETYFSHGEKPAYPDLFVHLHDNTVSIVKDEFMIDAAAISYISEMGDGFLIIDRNLVYQRTIAWNDSRALAGRIVDKEEIERLSALLGKDALAFLKFEDFFVIPQEFLDTNIYVRSVIEQAQEIESEPFTISDGRGGFSTFMSSNIFLVDKVTLGNADLFVLQSQSLLILIQNRFVPFVIVIIAAIFLFSFLLSTSLNSYISRALSAVLSGFESIRDGTFKRVRLKSSDELGEIAHELNNSMAFIEQTLAKLSKSNEVMKKLSIEARQANKMKTEFLANMSHEMRTPMNAVLGFTELLMAEESDEDKKKQMEMIYKSAEHLLKLINDALDLSKIESGHMEILERTYSVRDLVEEIVQTNSPMARSKGLHLTYGLSEDAPPYLEGDDFRIRQVLSNLVTNSLKFTSRGYVSLLAQRQEEKILYVVQDTGTGIAEEDIARAFDPFIQLDSKMSRSYSGTGLGLTITKRLTEMMNGELDFQSMKGEGTRAIVKLPLKMPSEERIRKYRLSRLRKRFSVLISSSNKEFQRTVRDALVHRGIPYGITESSEKSFDVIRSGYYTAVVIDGTTYDKRVAYALDSGNARIIVAEGLNTSEVSNQLNVIGILPADFDSRCVIELLDRIPLRGTSLMRDKENYKILVAEDNEANQTLIKRILEKEGFVVEIVSNGQEVIEVLEGEQYELILMDMQMPMMDGYETTRVLRGKGNEVPIVALTAHTMRGDEEKTLEAGCNGYLGKPVKRDELLRIVELYLGYQGDTPRRVEHADTDEEDEAKLITDGEVVRRMATFAESMGLNETEAAEMFREYGQFLKEVLRNLKKSLERRDFERIAVEGHGLKGSGTMYGFDEISSVGVEIEKASFEKDAERLESLLTELVTISRDFWEDASEG